MLVLSLEEEQCYDKIEQDYEINNGHREQCRAEARSGKKNPASCGSRADTEKEQATSDLDKVTCAVKIMR